jgi:hypothetical protein
VQSGCHRRSCLRVAAHQFMMIFPMLLGVLASRSRAHGCGGCMLCVASRTSQRCGWPATQAAHEEVRQTCKQPLYACFDGGFRVTEGLMQMGAVVSILCVALHTSQRCSWPATPSCSQKGAADLQAATLCLF